MFCAHRGTRTSPMDANCSSCGWKPPSPSREVATGVLTTATGRHERRRVAGRDVPPGRERRQHATCRAPLSEPQDQDAPTMIPVPSRPMRLLADVGLTTAAERADDPDATIGGRGRHRRPSGTARSPPQDDGCGRARLGADQAVHLQRTARDGPGVRHAVSHHPRARGRRHGRRLSGVGRGAGRLGGGQGDPAGDCGRSAAAPKSNVDSSASCCSPARSPTRTSSGFTTSARSTASSTSRCRTSTASTWRRS